MGSSANNVTQTEIRMRLESYPVQFSDWREQFMQGGKSAFYQIRDSDSKDDEINDLKERYHHKSKKVIL